MKILIADDSKTDRIVLTKTLEKLGHSVISCGDGLSAIKLFKQESPSLVILDVMMPKLDGIECAKKIRQIKLSKWVPIIFLSATKADETNIAEGLTAGGDDYLTKPFNEVILSAKIKAMQRVIDIQNHLSETTHTLSIISSTDALTGLFNRLEFDKIIKEKLKYGNKNNQKVTLLFLDLDNFKIINDSLGHAIGDKLLKKVAERLKFCVSKDDFLARIGGDEFAIILNKVEHINEVDLVAKKIIEVLSPAYHIDEHEIHISSSIGIVCDFVNRIDPTVIIQNADTAMYHAKQLGRNNYQYFTAEIDQKQKQRSALSNALKFALERNELYLTYQPVFDLKTRKIVSIEALLCWKHPELGIISPDIFIPLAEETGLITPIGHWVFQTACQQTANWYLAGYTNFKISINLSSRQLLQKKLVNFIIDTLEQTQLPPNMLEVELTETGMMENPLLSEKIIKAIHDIGINIIIDDFGIGYSSFLRLKQLPISALKIDKFFVKGVASNPNDAIIVNALIAMANKMNLNVIAEGIETKEHLIFLLNNHCPQGQGFYLSKPKTIIEMTSYFKEKYEK